MEHSLFLVSDKRPIGASSEIPVAAVEAGLTTTGYDQLDFSRPSRELKQHYHSTSTLKSVKSSIEKSESKNLIPVPDLRKERHLSTGDYIDASFLTQNPQRSSLGHLTKGELPKVTKI
jgi:hypothetical protein